MKGIKLLSIFVGIISFLLLLGSIITIVAFESLDYTVYSWKTLNQLHALYKNSYTLEITVTLALIILIVDICVTFSILSPATSSQGFSTKVKKHKPLSKKYSHKRRSKSSLHKKNKMSPLKKIGITFIVLQILALMGASISGNMADAGLFEWVGFMTFGIIGTILLIRDYKKKSPHIQLYEREIDRVLVNDMNTNYGIRIKEDLIDLLTKAEIKTPQQFEKVSSGMDYKQWALFHVANQAFDLIASGEYHLYDTLTFEGQRLLHLYENCLKTALACHYITKEDYERQKQIVHQQVYETGKWA